ncbi:50S ribosomal protein L22 [candidate division NPL-UPA2 bacterium Unc8]|uniref:Large ribosomal subunit protein uL22 n=1 Tax=candidate division NPL-UPA2 bacterium Unc8 TaxID=1980939 RepID=A0A399FY53_UNCN2|nr:50S ribosomal protein L22 [Bacillota bacterium]MBT9147245.1 50S ribosomal protein L22 [Bacillota bacterium]RII00300.1 MAG: 50S ribosomal protein L22 [candidate division NPL-UPA2 bacterium Unc8]
MEAKAVTKHIPLSPYKLRQVVDLIRGKDVEEAVALVRFVRRAAAKPVEKVLKSAISNAGEGKTKARVGQLYVAEARVDGGPSLKRGMPRARGVVTPILKRSSHITIVLREKD